MTSTRLMTTFLKRLKNGEFNLNPGDEMLAWPQSEPRRWNACMTTFRNSFWVHCFDLLPHRGQGGLNDTIFVDISKLGKIYLVYTSKNLKLTLNCHKNFNFDFFYLKKRLCCCGQKFAILVPSMNTWNVQRYFCDLELCAVMCMLLILNR